MFKRVIWVDNHPLGLQLAWLRHGKFVSRTMQRGQFFLWFLVWAIQWRKYTFLFIFVVGYRCSRFWMQFKSYCYFVGSSIKNWDQAQLVCKKWGGELVKINSFDENEFVLKLVHSRAPSLKQVWIGLKWNPSVNKFLWSDNSVPFFKF